MEKPSTPYPNQQQNRKANKRMNASQPTTDQTATPVATNPQAGICLHLSEGVLVPIQVNPSLSPRHGFKLKNAGGHFSRISRRFAQYYLSDESEQSSSAGTKTGDLFMGRCNTLQAVTTQGLIQIFGKGLNGIPLCISSLEQIATLVEADYAKQQAGQTPSCLTREGASVNVFIVPQKVTPKEDSGPTGASGKPCVFTFGKTKETTHSSSLIYRVGQDSFILRELTLLWDPDHLGWAIDTSPIVAPDRQHPWVTGARFFHQDMAGQHSKVNKIVKVVTTPDKTLYRRDQPSPRPLPLGYHGSSL